MSIERIGVVGMGLLGRGIAGCFLGRNFEVVAIARTPQRLDDAEAQIEVMIGELIDLAGFDPALRESWRKNLIKSTDFHALSGCQFVVESVLEDAAIKHDTFAKIEAVTAADTIIASNSSAIPISALQEKCSRPQNLIGMHWAEPAHITRFMEIIRGNHTSDHVAAKTSQLARRLGKDPSICKSETSGFIANRIGYAMYREALSLLESGVADAETIDRSMRNALGLWATLCGPLRWIDLTGGPELYYKAMKPVFPALSKAEEPAELMKQLAESGARGIANQRGFFNYTPEEAKKWEEMFRQHAWAATRLQNQYFPIAEERAQSDSADRSAPPPPETKS